MIRKFEDETGDKLITKSWCVVVKPEDHSLSFFTNGTIECLGEQEIDWQLVVQGFTLINTGYFRGTRIFHAVKKKYFNPIHQIYYADSGCLLN